MNNQVKKRQERALLSRVRRFERIDEIRKSYTKKGRFVKSFLHLEYENEDGEAMQAGDGGRGAVFIRSFDEREPAWLVAFDKAIERLDVTELAVANALLEDCRPARAAQKTGFSRMTVYRVLHALRDRFEEAHRLYWTGEE